ncbi:MAG TPA: di-heme oxidoredictase family protein [Vicinamibacteria bacterium]|nr:di-heme oxidoredictase family protein [Vicinamibacteria bacterium]
MPFASCTRRRLPGKGVFATAVAAGLLAGCGSEGIVTDRLDTVDERDLSGIAQPADAARQPVQRIPRAVYGTANTPEALAYPGLTDQERSVFLSALDFFITEHTEEEGIGPIFNQNRCLGCHQSADDIPPGTGLLQVSTPVSRAARQGPTDHSVITRNNPPPTAAFTLFGTFFPASGGFDPLAAFGGPIQHIRTTGDCEADIIPPESIDPTLRGGIDPTTGLSAIGGRRAIGERAAPPYAGRGLMEAIFAGDIVANDDPSDTQGHFSTLQPPGPECANDCISGRHNENSAEGAFLGGDPVVRVARFGLRAAGPTLFQFMIGGTQGEIGFTSPFAPFEQNNNQNVGRNCDIAPDPELRAQEVVNLRTLIRLIGIPEFDARLLQNPPADDEARDIQTGAVLFGVDLAAFRSRMIAGMTPVGTGPDAERGIAADRKLNCVGCHTPIMPTGRSPAALGASHLSNRWVPLFSNLLLHDMGQVRQSLANPVPPPGTSRELSRNLADFALPGQGVASGQEWRTPPLMALGRVGPPFLHDARVFLNPDAPATTVFSASDVGVNRPVVITDVDAAIGAAIELHDLPPPAPGCPQPGALPNDVCPAQGERGMFRSEARNVMQRWRALTLREQIQVIKFLKAL